MAISTDLIQVNNTQIPQSLPPENNDKQRIETLALESFQAVGEEIVPSLQGYSWVRICSSMVASMYGGICSLFSKERLIYSVEELESMISNLEKDDPKIPSIYRVNLDVCIGAQAYIDYAEILNKKFPDSFLFTDLMPRLPPGAPSIDTRQMIQSILEKVANYKMIAIPVILTQTMSDHLVTFCIDQETSTLDFYDPKGVSIEDNRTANLYKNNLNLKEIATELLAAFKIKTVRENTQIHQYNNHDCGYYSLHYIEQRFAGASHETLCQNNNLQLDAFRKQIIRQLIDEGRVTS